MSDVHDEFDDVPADASYRGAHRGDAVGARRGLKGLLWVVLAGVAALAVGAACFLMAPRSAAPTGTTSTSSSTSTASASASGWEGNPESASASASGSSSASSSKVAVYNQSAVAGAASTAATTLRNAGWTVSDVSNWDGDSQAQSVVLYTSGHQMDAKKVAKALGISQVTQQKGLSYPVTVVLDEQADG